MQQLSGQTEHLFINPFTSFTAPNVLLRPCILFYSHLPVTMQVLETFARIILNLPN